MKRAYRDTGRRRHPCWVRATRSVRLYITLRSASFQHNLRSSLILNFVAVRRRYVEHRSARSACYAHGLSVCLGERRIGNRPDSPARSDIWIRVTSRYLQSFLTDQQLYVLSLECSSTKTPKRKRGRGSPEAPSS